MAYNTSIKMEAHTKRISCLRELKGRVVNLETNERQRIPLPRGTVTYRPWEYQAVLDVSSPNHCTLVRPRKKVTWDGHQVWVLNALMACKGIWEPWKWTAPALVEQIAAAYTNHLLTRMKAEIRHFNHMVDVHGEDFRDFFALRCAEQRVDRFDVPAGFLTKVMDEWDGDPHTSWDTKASFLYSAGGSYAP